MVQKIKFLILATLMILITGCGQQPPSEEVVINSAKSVLLRSEDAEYFYIKDIKITNTSTQSNSYITKIHYIVVAKRSNILMSATGEQHVLPLGRIHKGGSYKGSFRLVMKQYDKGWEVDSYRRD